MKKILIVDDSAFMRNVLRELLTEKNGPLVVNHDVEIYEADGKENALGQMNKINPDLILLDVVMKSSETEGLEFLKEIENKFDTKKVIMISSVGQIELTKDTLKLGIMDYIEKPFEPAKVINKVNKVLG